MKNGFGILLLMLLFANCQRKETSIGAIPELQDTLKLPHYIYKDYDAIFKNEKPKDYQKETEFIAHFFQDYWAYNQVSGGLLVAKNGNILFEGYRGYANVANKDTLTAKTPVHIASISKVLTALAVLKLVEADKLHLDDQVHRFFPDFPYKTITIQDLLSHRSGLPNYAYFEHHPILWDTHVLQTNESMMHALTNKISEPYNPPNTTFSYCNTNFAILALIIEKVTDLPYAQAMKYMIFDPLEMKDTFVFNIQDSANVSQSYSYRGKRWEFDYLDQIYGDKNIYSTPRDLFKMDKAMYAEDFLSKKLKNRMKKGYSYERKGVKNYGLGIRMMEWETGEKIFYHNGWWHGNYTTYVHGETDTVTVIALGNKRIRSVYSAFSLAGLFGAYPISVQVQDEKMIQDSLQLSEDSLMLELNALREKSKRKKDTATSKKKKLKLQKRTEDSVKILPLSTEKHTIDSIKLETDTI